MEPKSRNLRVFVFGITFYILLHSYLYSSYSEGNNFIEKYRSYVYYILGLDIALTLYRYFSSRKKGKLLNNKGKSLNNMSKSLNNMSKSLNNMDMQNHEILDQYMQQMQEMEQVQDMQPMQQVQDMQQMQQMQPMYHIQPIKTKEQVQVNPKIVSIDQIRKDTNNNDDIPTFNPKQKSDIMIPVYQSKK
jgi:hypothetical protein